MTASLFLVVPSRAHSDDLPHSQISNIRAIPAPYAEALPIEPSRTAFQTALVDFSGRIRAEADEGCFDHFVFLRFRTPGSLDPCVEKLVPVVGRRACGDTPDWHVGEDDDAIRLHMGDRGPLDAFYATEGGGEASEFGNWAIAGLQWRDPKRALVVGVGLPLALSNANGAFGLLCQIRMPLE